MKIIKAFFIFFVLISRSAFAEQASDESIKQILTITKSQKLIDGIKSQLRPQMDAGIKQALQGRIPNPGQAQAIDKFKNSMLSLTEEILSWEKLEPMYIRLYKKSLTEEEIVGIYTFYKTPAGKALINKMPILNQNIMQETYKLMSDLDSKAKVSQKTFANEMAEASK